jgi:N-formylglutamate amidohydrolase
MHDDEWGREAGLGAPFQVLEPIELLTPIVFDSPHSGDRYPRRFLAASRLDAQTLRRSEDAFVDDLVAPCVAIGAPLLRACFPRAYLDVNREPFELDPQMFEGRLPDFSNTRSLRVAAGLGAIPRVVGDAQPIYRGPIPVAEGLARIAALHRPYHECLTALLDRARTRYGLSILIDCHSMPSASTDVAGCDIVLGDRFGSSAAGWIVDAIEQPLRGRGLIVRRNKPYAGGYIAEHYGAPAQGRHAVQIEINRALYMDEKGMRKLEKAGSLAESLLDMARSLAARVRGLSGARLAAE